MQICKLRLSLIDLQICPLGKFEHLSELRDCVCKLAKLRQQVTNDLYRELFSDLKEPRSNLTNTVLMNERI